MPLNPSRKTPGPVEKTGTEKSKKKTLVLADSSAWVEYDRATGSVVHKRLRQLIDTDFALAVTEPVVMEICAGARNPSHESDLRRLFGALILLRFDTAVDFDGAARIYRLCRSQGITPRGLLDCMIASVAIRTGAALLAFDRDLIAIAGVMNLHLDPGCHD